MDLELTRTPWLRHEDRWHEGVPALRAQFVVLFSVKSRISLVFNYGGIRLPDRTACLALRDSQSC